MRLLNAALLSFILTATAAGSDAALAVIQKISGTVGFYAADGTHLKDVKVGSHPHEGVFSSDGRWLYVSDNGILWMTDPGEGGNTISVVDVRAMKKEGVIDLGKYHRPHGMDIDRNTGRLAVTTENPDGMLLIDPVARKVLRFYDVKGADPHMLVFGPKGEWVYVSNTASGTIAAVNLASGHVKLIPADARPQGAVLSHEGKRLYVTNSDGNTISILDTEKRAPIGTIRTGKGPNRIELTPDGKTLVYSLGADQAVGFVDVAAGREVKVVPIGGRPLSLTMSADGRTAYAGIQDQDKIIVLSVPGRKVLRVIHTPEKSGPDPALPLP